MVRLHRSTEHRAYALWACPELPSTANVRHRQPPASMKLARAFNPRATHENTLVMRRSVAHFSCRQAPGVEPCCARRGPRPALGLCPGRPRASLSRSQPPRLGRPVGVAARSAAPNLDPTSTRMGIGAYAEDGLEWSAQWSQASMSDAASCAARWW